MYSVPESHDQQFAKKRSRSVLNKWSDLTACDNCRFRKVKCIRLEETNRDCEACMARREPCQNMRNKSTKHRESKFPAAVVSYKRQEVISASQPSAESNLHRTELSEHFMAELLASFFQPTDDKVPYANFEHIQQDFERAGRRLKQLDSATEPLVLAMMASAAQFSDSPVLLGPNAPRLKDLTSVTQCPNLAQFGRQRRALCGQLLEEVIKLADVRGLYRRASSQSISVLMMLPRLVRYPRPLKSDNLDDMEDTWRPFVSAALEHVRTLRDGPGTETFDFGRIQWPLVIGDAVHSVYTGYNLLVTDEDLVDFPNMTGIPLLSVEITRKFIISGKVNEFMYPLIAAANQLISVGRKIANTIAIPHFKKRQVKLESFIDCLGELRQGLKTLYDCQQVAEELKDAISPSILELQKLTIGASIPKYLKYGPLTLSLFMSALYLQFQQFKVRRDPITVLDDDNSFEELRVLQMQQQLEVGLVEAILAVANIIRSLEGTEMVASLTRHTSLLVSSHERLLMYIDLAFDLPTIEQRGSCALWTHEVKLDTVRILIDAIQLQTWAWSDREADVATREYKYQQYRDFVQYQTPPIPSQIPPLMDIDLDKFYGLEPPDMPSSTTGNSPFDASSFIDLVLGSSLPLPTEFASPTISSHLPSPATSNSLTSPAMSNDVVSPAQSHELLSPGSSTNPAYYTEILQPNPMPSPFMPEFPSTTQTNNSNIPSFTNDILNIDWAMTPATDCMANLVEVPESLANPSTTMSDSLMDMTSSWMDNTSSWSSLPVDLNMDESNLFPTESMHYYLNPRANQR